MFPGRFAGEIGQHFRDVDLYAVPGDPHLNMAVGSECKRQVLLKRTCFQGRLQPWPSTNEEVDTSEAMECEPPWIQFLGLNEFLQCHMWRDVLVEFFATAALTVASIGAVLSSFGRQPGPGVPPRVDPPAIGVAISHFFLLGFGIISTRGGHLNPLITFFTALLGLTKPLRALAYIVAQTLGAIIGSLLMKIALPTATRRWTMNEEGQGELAGCAAGSQVDHGQLFLLEFGFSAFLLLVAHGVAFDQRESLVAGPIVGPLIISATLGVLIFASGTLVPAGFSGAGMNPARCFGPALVTGGDNWDNWWVYWLAPFTAAGVTAAALCLIQTPELEDYHDPVLPSLTSNDAIKEKGS
mmetsp:Transcript_49714/g.118489  ORF Transcript_49714/g.118489 Transcript_49714/m.118489 type:complete len:354 (+) Transcript_49714:75-1136(+)